MHAHGALETGEIDLIYSCSSVPLTGSAGARPPRIEYWIRPASYLAQHDVQTRGAPLKTTLTVAILNHSIDPRAIVGADPLRPGPSCVSGRCRREPCRANAASSSISSPPLRTRRWARALRRGWARQRLRLNPRLSNDTRRSVVPAEIAQAQVSPRVREVGSSSRCSRFRSSNGRPRRGAVRRRSSSPATPISRGRRASTSNFQQPSAQRSQLQCRASRSSDLDRSRRLARGVAMRRAERGPARAAERSSCARPIGSDVSSAR